MTEKIELTAHEVAIRDRELDARRRIEAIFLKALGEVTVIVHTEVPEYSHIRMGVVLGFLSEQVGYGTASVAEIKRLARDQGVPAIVTHCEMIETSVKKRLGEALKVRFSAE